MALRTYLRPFFLPHRLLPPPGPHVLAGRGGAKEHHVTDHRSESSSVYLEGNSLGGGWSYRINRVVKPMGELAYTAILTHEDPSTRAEKMHLWLSEFATIEEARTAAHNVLLEWCKAPHYSLSY